MNQTLIHRTIGSNIRAAREAAGLSLAALSVQTGLPVQTLEAGECGAHALSASELFEITRILGPSVSWLYKGVAGGAPTASPRPR